MSVKRPRARIRVMSPDAYLDRECNRITYERFQELHRQPGYALIRHYEGENFRISATWEGVIPAATAASTFPGTWAPFKLTVMNRTGEDFDPWVLDPTLTDKYVTEDELIAKYEEVLSSYSDSYRDNEGKLVEVGDKSWVGEVGGDDTPEETIETFGTW